MLGHEKTGSFALSSDKTELFSVALGAFLDVICETFNNQGIPSLIDINGSHFDGIEDYPTLAHGDVDKRDITKLSTFLKDMVGTGILYQMKNWKIMSGKRQTCRKEQIFQIPGQKMNRGKTNAELRKNR